MTYRDFCNFALEDETVQDALRNGKILLCKSRMSEREWKRERERKRLLFLEEQIVARGWVLDDERKYLNRSVGQIAELEPVQSRQLKREETMENILADQELHPITPEARAEMVRTRIFSLTLC
jgi:hypothetical protein